MAQKMINFRMEESLKNQMEEVCREMGISLSTAFTIFAKKVTKERRIPFQFIDLKYKTKKGKYSYNDVIIMADTETAKSINYPNCLDNYVVAWSMAFRAYNRNLITLYGHSPTEFIDCLNDVIKQ